MYMRSCQCYKIWGSLLVQAWQKDGELLPLGTITTSSIRIGYDHSYRQVEAFWTTYFEHGQGGSMFLQPYYFGGFAIPCCLRMIVHKNNRAEPFLLTVATLFLKWGPLWSVCYSCSPRPHQNDGHTTIFNRQLSPKTTTDDLNDQLSTWRPQLLTLYNCSFSNNNDASLTITPTAPQPLAFYSK
jgi:hypothetical protein